MARHLARKSLKQLLEEENWHLDAANDRDVLKIMSGNNPGYMKVIRDNLRHEAMMLRDEYTRRISVQREQHGALIRAHIPADVIRTIHKFTGHDAPLIDPHSSTGSGRKRARR